MATTSALKLMQDLHNAINDPPGGWTSFEAAVEVLKSAAGTNTIADGADVTEGAIADAVVAAGASGTISAKLRRLTTDIGILALQPTRFTNLGANATLNVKATPGSVVSCVCINTNAAVRYLQLHNIATFPADQGVPIYSFPVPPGGYGIGIGTDFFTNAGATFSTGIAFAFSTTPNTYTAGTASEQTTLIHFR